jgi:hypothetical protein
MRKCFIIFLLLSACMAKPQQPPLSGKETLLLKKIAQDCNCKVSREVSAQPGLVCKPVDLHHSYFIKLDYNGLKQSYDHDSLKLVSKDIVQKLLTNAISFGAYKIINVTFSFKKAKNWFTQIDFNYDGNGVPLIKDPYDFR